MGLSFPGGALAVSDITFISCSIWVLIKSSSLPAQPWQSLLVLPAPGQSSRFSLSLTTSPLVQPTSRVPPSQILYCTASCLKYVLHIRSSVSFRIGQVDSLLPVLFCSGQSVLTLQSVCHNQSERVFTSVEHFGLNTNTQLFANGVVECSNGQKT